jgi:hypothetical protein
MIDCDDEGAPDCPCHGRCHKDVDDDVDTFSTIPGLMDYDDTVEEDDDF